MTEQKKRKPDGYCAWHPEKGWLKGYDLFSVTQSFDGALDELREALHDDFDKANCAHYVRLNLGLEFVPWARAQGWQIREVYMLTAEELEQERRGAFEAGREPYRPSDPQHFDPTVLLYATSDDYLVDKREETNEQD